MSFEKAWELLKMPIVPHSVTRNEDGTQYTGEFQDPVTGEILPITGGIGDSQPGGKYGGAFIDRGENERGFPTWRSFIQFDTDKFHEDRGDYNSFIHPTEMGTDRKYRKRGYATALMDLITQIVQDHHGEKMYESDAQSSDAERFVEALHHRFSDYNDKGHRSWIGRDDLMEKAYREPDLWHGTLAEYVPSIMSEGLDEWSFGAVNQEEAERYADDRFEVSGKAPAILGFDVPRDSEWVDPRKHGYDLGSDFGHYMIEERIPPKNIRPYAIGHEGMTMEEWDEFVRQFSRLDYLDWFYNHTLDQKAWERKEQ